MRDNGEAADQDVANASFVQRSAETGEVFRLRCARAWRICFSIHDSASSKLAKR